MMTIIESIDLLEGDIEGERSDPSVEPAGRSNVGVLVGLAMAVIGMGFGASRIADNSFLTHLATGREMLDNGVVRNDVFTWTSQGESIVVQSWLASLLYGVVDELAGFHGLRLLTALLGAVLGAMAWRMTKSQPSIVTRVAVMVPTLAIGYLNWGERPLLIAFVFFASMILIAEGDGRPRWLFVIGALWINVHGSWPLGIVYLVARIAGGFGDRENTRRERDSLKYLGVGMLLGGIFNPYGPAMLFFPLDLLGRQEVLSHVVEWQSPSFNSTWTRAFLLMVLGAFAALMQNPKWRHALPTMIFVAAALVGRRNIAVASLVMLPVLAAGLPAIGRLAAARTSEAIRMATFAFAAMLVIIPLTAVSGPHIDVDRFPEDAVTAMELKLGLAPGETRIIHQDFVGNYLDVRYGASGAGVSWIDDRFELHDISLVNDYMALLDAGPAWPEILDRYDAEAILWPSDAALVSLARDIGGWDEVWSDEDWTVLRAPGHTTS
jgi:hypothetical protein